MRTNMKITALLWTAIMLGSVAPADAAVASTTATPDMQAVESVTMDVRYDRPSGEELREMGLTATAAASVRRVTWYQKSWGYLHVWNEKHEGVAYYDDTRVWMKTRHRSKIGWHDCDLSSGVGFTISNTRCTERGEYSGAVDAVDIYKVSAIANGVPVHGSHQMIAHVTKHGKVSFQAW